VNILYNQLITLNSSNLLNIKKNKKNLSKFPKMKAISNKAYKRDRTSNKNFRQKFAETDKLKLAKTS
jgi:hypothetical protein